MGKKVIITCISITVIILAIITVYLGNKVDTTLAKINITETTQEKTKVKDRSKLLINSDEYSYLRSYSDDELRELINTTENMEEKEIAQYTLENRGTEQ